MFKRKFTYILFLLLITYNWNLFAQCDPSVPIFNVDLTGQPNGIWTSTPVPRAGNCCGSVAPDKCVRINLTLDPGAVAINFQIASGAVPPGALYYQIGCGPPVAVGSPICLNGPGPYVLTFCKPGNNINTYAITSIAAPTVSPDDTIGNGCSTTMHASGLLQDNTITWSSVAPGSPGQYNSYLSCTIGCDSTVVTGNLTAPTFVDYVVCGTPVAGACVGTGPWCDTIRIHFTPPLLPTINPNPAIYCASNTNGILLTGNINGGLPPYTYAWANSTGVVGTNSTYNATAAGTYTFTIYDKNYPACPATSTTVNVTVNPVPIVNAGPDQSLCATSVALAGSVTGATGGIWSGGAGNFNPGNTSLNATYTPTAAELSSGIVILTLTSTGNGTCTPVTDQVVINISPPIAVTLATPAVVCFGQTSTITANVTGGIPAYNYLWSNGTTTQSILNVVPGTYSISVTGSGAATCVATSTVTITANPEIIVTTSPNNSISCSTTALISATASGGTGTLTYLWNNGATTPSTSVYSGTYIITVTDAVGCTANNSISVLAANSSLTAMVNQPPVLCNGATTTLTAIANGGFGNYTYSWSTGATTNSIVAGAGSYCCTVTDGGGCITSACVTVTQNPPLNLTVPTPATICFAGSTSVYASVSGGQPPYTYNWSNGQTTQSITAPAGNYTVTVGDAIGCTRSTTVTINQATLLNSLISFTEPSCFGGNNGTATTVVSGGTPPYFYSWSPYGGSGATASGLMTGTFTVTITDAIGCATTSSVNVTQPAAIAATVVVNNNVSCNGGNNGSATVNPSGGTPGYTYSWSPIGGSAQSATTLTAGNYFITITDSRGCVQTAQTNITQPTLLVSSLTATTTVSCNGGSDGSATVAATGGTPGYTYSWAPSGGLNSTALNLGVGTYTATITDLNGCQSQITANIIQPTPVLASVSASSDVSCFGGTNGTATASATGGTPPYTYSWNSNPVQTTQTAGNLSAGTYIVTVTDSRGCSNPANSVTLNQPTELVAAASPNTFISCTSTVNISGSATGGTPGYSYSWSNGSNSQVITVNTGTYIVTVTDAFGCSDTSSVSVIASNSTLTTTINQPPRICFGSTTTISAVTTGGVGNYSYMWDNGFTTPSITVGAGSSCVTVTDDIGCISNACVNVLQNTQLAATIGTPPLVCPGATTSINANATGGQAPYFYVWSNSQTTQSIVVPVGTYSVLVSDATGASCNTSASVTVNQNPAILLDITSTNVSCVGANNGTAMVLVSGGSPGYTYSWSPSGGVSFVALNLSPTIYTVTVTDAIGCIKTGTVQITQPASPVGVNVISNDVICFGQTNGSAIANPTGGNAPHFYYWEPSGSDNDTIGQLAQGTYTVTVSDSTGCFTTSQVTIDQPTDITVSTLSNPATCAIDNGSSTASASGGVGAYTYNWQPLGGNQQTADSLAPGNYVLTVTDANLCVEQVPVSISEILSSLNAGFNSNSACTTHQTLFNDLSNASNDSIVAYSWNFGDSLSTSGNTSTVQNPIHVYSGAGNYSVTLIVLSEIGCRDTFVLPVTVHPLPVVSFTRDTLCQNLTSLFTNSSSVNPGNITNWLWNFGDPGSMTANTSILQNPGHNYSNAGTYTVSLYATSNNGCLDSLKLPLTIMASPVAAFTSNSICLNQTTQYTDASFATGSSITQWFWNFGDNSAIDSTQSPSHVFSTSGAFNTTLTVVSANGCINIDTGVVNVFSLPVANFTAPDVCFNNPTPFVNQSTVSSGTIANYIWDFGNFTPVNTTQNPNYIYGSSGTFNVSLIVNTNNGCKDTIVKAVNVSALPVANFQNTVACEDSTVLFTDLSTVPGGIPITTWIWAYGDGSPIGTVQHPSHMYFLPGNYNVSLVAGYANGCRDTVTKPVTVYGTPTPEFIVADSSGCATYCTTFTDLSLPNSGTMLSWEWDFGDNSLSSSNTNIVHCYPNSGFYTISLTVTNSFGCKNVKTQTNLIIVYPVPEAEFTLSPQTTTTLDPTINFTDQSLGAVGWQWNFADPYNPGGSSELNPSHTYNEPGNYCVSLIVENLYHCFDTTVHCLFIEPEFTFYIPNAFSPQGSDGLNDVFSGQGTNFTDYDMWIFDRWGDQIFHTNDIKVGWNGHANDGKEVAQQDVYIYMVVVKDFKGNDHKYHGHVTIVR